MLLGLVGLRCHATVELVDALLFGDILWMYSLYFLLFLFFSSQSHLFFSIVFYMMMEEVTPGIPWTFGSHFSFWIVVLLALMRTAFLIDQRFLTKQNPKR